MKGIGNWGSAIGDSPEETLRVDASAVRQRGLGGFPHVDAQAASRRVRLRSRRRGAASAGSVPEGTTRSSKTFPEGRASHRVRGSGTGGSIPIFSKYPKAKGLNSLLIAQVVFIRLHKIKQSA